MYRSLKEIVKCLLCSTVFDSEEDLINHYMSYQKIDPSNRFFQKLLLSSKNYSVFRKCLRCNDFVTTSDYKKKHNFLNYFLKTANLLKFEITVNKYGEYYDFTNSEKVVDDFFKNVRSRFKLSCLRLIKCLFVIESIHQSMSENVTPILNTRY